MDVTGTLGVGDESIVQSWSKILMIALSSLIPFSSEFPESVSATTALLTGARVAAIAVDRALCGTRSVLSLLCFHPLISVLLYQNLQASHLSWEYLWHLSRGHVQVKLIM